MHVAAIVESVSSPPEGEEDEPAPERVVRR
jgi:hypothetical protein